MAFEPINIFSRTIDPDGVFGLMQKLGKKLLIEKNGTTWTKATIVGERAGWFGKAPQLIIGHSAEYCQGESWKAQREGMAGYFSRFPGGENKDKVLVAIHGFEFALAVRSDDFDIDDAGDVRRSWLEAICRHLDGVLFSPSTLRDASGRILLGSDGQFDSRAQFPKVLISISLDESPNRSAEPANDVTEALDPPSANRVAQRAMVLAAMVNRGFLELDYRKEPSQRLASGHRHMWEWLKKMGLFEEFEPDEASIFQRGLGKLDEQSVVNSIWRLEGLTVLAWALGRGPLPPYDELAQNQKINRSLEFLEWPAAEAVVAGARLRPKAELEAMHKCLLACHWRLRNFRLNGQPVDFEEFSRTCWFGGFDIRAFRILEKDLALGKHPIAKASEDLVDTVASCSRERHLAINWLLGYSKIYSETDTST